jgi:hypothetical protein
VSHGTSPNPIGDALPNYHKTKPSASAQWASAILPFRKSGGRIRRRKSMAWLEIDPNIDPLRKNPRFQTLVASAK